ncbi:MAG: hypothetical protein WCS94_03535 [Verrucomicrobiota bacterium]
MNLTLYLFSVPLLTISVGMVFSNLWIAFGGLIRKREKFQSLIPFVGGMLGTIGLLLLPMSQPRRFWWVPLIMDLGCGPMLVAIVIDQIRKKLRSR